MSNKNFKSIDEQIELLSSRGLSIEDFEKAKKFLMHNNYYRISGYTLTLRKNDVFSKNATIQNVIDIYSFDHECILRSLAVTDAFDGGHSAELNGRPEITQNSLS